MKIEIIDYIWSKIEKSNVDQISPCLKYMRKRRVQGDYAMEEIIEEASFIDGRNGKFLTGFLPRIKEFCSTNSLNIEINEIENLPKPLTPILPNLTFREDQKTLLLQAGLSQRGVIKSPTGTGKTVVVAGICNMWPKSNILFLCHTLDLLTQSYKAFTEEFLLGKVIALGGGSKDKIDWERKERTIVVSTRQSWDKIDYSSHRDFFDIVIIDECHHCSKSNSQYANFLEESLAIGRFGVSATLPESEQGKMTLEGYLGPVIGEFSIQEAISKGVLAKPSLDLIPVPYSDSIGTIERYKDTFLFNKENNQEELVEGIYTKGIVKNKTRNRLALLSAIETLDDDGSVLIMVSPSNIDHGKILSEMAKDIFGLDIPFVCGETKKDKRLFLKEALERKEIKALIANIVWFEGINIKSINHVINAAGGKSSIQAEQIPGRGLRTTETKKTLRYTDFLDPYKYLSHHTVMRLIVYANLGWTTWRNNG